MRYIIIMSVVFLTAASTLLIGGKPSDAKAWNQDAAAILKVSRPLLQDQYRIHLKWSGEGAGYASLDAFQTNSRAWSKKLNIQSSDSLEAVNGLPLQRSRSNLHADLQLQSVLIGSKDAQTTVLILELLSSPSIGIDQLIQTQKHLDQILIELGFEGAWNITVQGELTHAELGEQPEAFILRMSRELHGIQQEFYQDDHTVSVSLLTNQIQSTVQSGTHKVNVQVALHQNSITKAWRLTIGSPLITMEY